MAWPASPEIFRETVFSMKENNSNKKKVYQLCLQELNSHIVVLSFVNLGHFSPMEERPSRSRQCCPGSAVLQCWGLRDCGSSLFLWPCLWDSGQAWVHNDQPSGGVTAKALWFKALGFVWCQIIVPPSCLTLSNIVNISASVSSPVKWG